MAWQSVPRIHETRLFRKRNVVGVGIANKVVGGRRTDEPCVVVFVERKVPRSQLRPNDLIPETIEAMKTDVVETGRIQALQARTDRWRPAPGGVSIGHYRITAGTLGVVARRADARMILSNNHVLAKENAASIGDPILQPGPYDGGTDRDRIATLDAFVPIVFDGFLDWLLSLFGIARPVRNVVDAALGKPLSDADVSDEILEIGTVSGTVSGTIGMPVKKSGRTTGLTQGQITAVAATIRVFYGLTRTARFRDQLVASALSQGGDSGSLIVDADNRAIGLLFAGSSNTTILNPIGEVERLLGIGF
ncbi:MAG TPA: hypothetical protein VEM77_02405 [Thermoplasmata archaeon]|nr:hypothetical protein [Thermoplasmata archaeon]